MDQIRTLTDAQLKSDLPEIKTGDTVKVAAKVVEGTRERIQTFEGTVMRMHGIQGAYEQLKEATRGQRVTREDLHALIYTLAIPEADKARLLALTPATYIGMAASLARRI